MTMKRPDNPARHESRPRVGVRMPARGHHAQRNVACTEDEQSESSAHKTSPPRHIAVE